MNTIADYIEWKLRKQQAVANAANIVLQSSQGSPDEIAGDLNLANEFGKVTGNPVPPLPMVQEYRSVFQQKIEEARNKTILSNAPRLADWLRDPENAALSRDDLERLFIANIAVNYATYDTRERQGYGYNSSFDLDRTLADKFFHLRDKLYPESNYLLSCDAEANFGFASPWNVGVSTGFGYAVKNFIFSLHNDEGAFSVVNTDVDPETQRRIHEALTWFKNTFGITAVADCLATVILNGKPAGPFVHDPLDGREPFELPCATRWFKNPNASFEVTPGNEKTETARPNTDSIHQAPLHP